MSLPTRSKASLFVADLHLPAGPSIFRERFRAFCAGPARDASAVYILGDLFEYWIGDDVGIEVYADEVAALLALSSAGVPVHFAHGNRDFLVGQRFFEMTEVSRLGGQTRIDLAGQPTLLSHGDELCIDDIAYQRWRRFCRNPVAQALFRALPRGARDRIAGGIRKTSLVDKRMKPDDIMDVNDGAVRAAFERHDVSRIIHGHTHRPAEQRYEIDGRACERIVLADWRPQRMEYLRVDASGVRRLPVN